MAKKSVQVSNRNANARFVISSVNTHAAEITQALGEIDAALAPAVRLGPDGIRRMLDWLAAALRHKDRALEQAELAYVAEQADDAPQRARRDELAAALKGQMASARERVSTVLGADAVRLYGLDGVAARTPAARADRAAVVIDMLRKHPRDEPDGLGGRLDTVALATALADTAGRLGAALAAVTTEKRELEAALLHRNATTVAWTDAYQGVADALTGLYRLAGRRDLAERIRPTVRRAIGEEPPPADDPGDADDGEDGAP